MGSWQRSGHISSAILASRATRGEAREGLVVSSVPQGRNGRQLTANIGPLYVRFLQADSSEAERCESRLRRGEVAQGDLDLQSATVQLPTRQHTFSSD